MCGNGAGTGKAATAAVLRQTREELHRALTACFVAAAGTTIPATAGWQIASTAIPTTASAT